MHSLCQLTTLAQQSPLQVSAARGLRLAFHCLSVSTGQAWPSLSVPLPCCRTGCVCSDVCFAASLCFRLHLYCKDGLSGFSGIVQAVSIFICVHPKPSLTFNGQTASCLSLDEPVCAKSCISCTALSANHNLVSFRGGRFQHSPIPAVHGFVNALPVCIHERLFFVPLSRPCPSKFYASVKLPRLSLTSSQNHSLPEAAQDQPLPLCCAAGGVAAGSPIAAMLKISS